VPAIGHADREQAADLEEGDLGLLQQRAERRVELLLRGVLDLVREVDERARVQHLAMDRGDGDAVPLALPFLPLGLAAGVSAGCSGMASMAFSTSSLSCSKGLETEDSVGLSSTGSSETTSSSLTLSRFSTIQARWCSTGI
jgi:hypothetical protein